MARLRLIVRWMSWGIFYALLLINAFFVFILSSELFTVLTSPEGDYPPRLEQHFYYCSTDVYFFQTTVFLFLFGQSLVLGWFFARLKKTDISILFLMFPLILEVFFTWFK